MSISTLLAPFSAVENIDYFSSSANSTVLLSDNEELDNTKDREVLEYSILTSTLQEPIGMVGFEGNYAIIDDYSMVEITVQFVTPPAVALRLIEDSGIELPITHYPSDTYEERALLAHHLFHEQLEQILPSDSIIQPEIISTHHTLFNGVHMRVPAFIVEEIAGLEEVFLVEPHILLTESEIPIESKRISMPSNGDAEITSFLKNPDLMGETRELLNIDYIHQDLGITGSGVRVAIIDSGINHNHPEFARFLDGTGRIRGWQRSDNYYMGVERHGTWVVGALVAIAPNIELWHYRTGIGGLSWLQAFEYAYIDGIDVVNLSNGNPNPSHPLQHSSSYAINTARIAHDENGRVATWWLRSSASVTPSDGRHVNFITAAGLWSHTHQNEPSIHGIRPALWIRISEIK